MLGEIRRVLKPQGWLIVEAIAGEAQETTPDHYASFWWRHVNDLAALLAENGFEMVRRSAFTEPWLGEQLCLRRK